MCDRALQFAGEECFVIGGKATLLDHVIFNMDTHEADSCVRGFRAYSNIWTPFRGRIADVQIGKWKSK